MLETTKRMAAAKKEKKESNVTDLLGGTKTHKDLVTPIHGKKVSSASLSIHLQHLLTSPAAFSNSTGCIMTVSPYEVAESKYYIIPCRSHSFRTCCLSPLEAVFENI